MKQIKIKDGIFALVDDEDFEKVNQYKWSYHKYSKANTGYAHRTLPGNKEQNMHRFIMGLYDKNYVIDHIDHNGLNNQKNNLRICTVQQNSMNQKKQKRNTQSKYKGVYFSQNKWVANIRYNKKTIYLGAYETEIEAAKKYNESAIYYFKEFALLNKI